MSTAISKEKTLADFRPFRPWRYDTQKVKADNVIAPPYDVISPAEQEALYAKSPYNCIRLILNKVDATDDESNSRYTRARDFFAAWRKDGVLVQEEEPSFYLYQQNFRDPRDGKPRSRSAFLGAIHLEPFEKHIVIPHEKTLAKPRADRKKLLEATQTNFSPIFGLYEDTQNQIVPLIKTLESEPVLFSAVDKEGVEHTLRALNGEEAVNLIRQNLAAERIYIADGHHRYTTALEYALEKKKDSSDQPSDFVYMAVVCFHDPGLVLFPTHRLIKNLASFEAEKVLSALETYFSVEKTAPEKIMPVMNANTSDLPWLGLVIKNDGYVLKLKDAATARAAMLPAKPDIWYSLDVNLFAHLILKSVFGLTEETWEAHLAFTHSDREALEEARSGKVQAAFMLKAPNVTVLREMGKVRELMPQKSTYFYPKLASGLLFFHHGEGSIGTGPT